MTFAPPTLVDLGRYLVAHNTVNLGIVGDTAHATKGTSYHLGSDLVSPTAYSVQTARDKAGLSLAASAIDIGKIDGGFTRLREFSVWFLAECQRNAPGTSDIREFIFSPDGIAVLRWDRERGVASAPKPGEAAMSHTGHSHASWYRDSEFRDKITPFRGYFEPEGAMKIDALVRQNWTANGTNGVLRAIPERAAPVTVRLAAGAPIVSWGEYFDTAGNSWRFAEYPAGSRQTAYFLRTGPGVAKEHDFLAGAIDPPTDCTAAIKAATDPLDARIAGIKAKVAANAADLADD